MLNIIKFIQKSIVSFVFFCGAVFFMLLFFVSLMLILLELGLGAFMHVQFDVFKQFIAGETSETLYMDFRFIVLMVFYWVLAGLFFLNVFIYWGARTLWKAKVFVLTIIMTLIYLISELLNTSQTLNIQHYFCSIATTVLLIELIVWYKKGNRFRFVAFEKVESKK